jgi:beta-lactam-binding protein with PASTA domain/cytochrome c peroxidase
MDANGNLIVDPVFGLEPRVTPRAAPAYFGHMWADEVFWDGRAGREFRDPLSGAVVIPAGDPAVDAGGALENQVLEPILNSTEMAKENRQWSEVIAKLDRVTPLAMAGNIPLDMANAVLVNPTYPALFSVAFGDPAVTPVRIAFAIATYQRTQVPDETPFDNGTMTDTQTEGFTEFRNLGCDGCHTPPLFTNNQFSNIALRPAAEDPGRQNVTGDAGDAGAMKTPSLRNVGLLRTFMHTGEFTTLQQVLAHYNNPAIASSYNFDISDAQRDVIAEFLGNGLTDPRVAAEQFPFDRPTLRSEAPADNQDPAAPGNFQGVAESSSAINLTWDPAVDNTGIVDYRLSRDGVVIAMLTGESFSDTGLDAGTTFNYTLVARDAVTNESLEVSVAVATMPNNVMVPAVLNLTQAAASAALVDAGLIVGDITTMFSLAVPAGSVISQSPESGRSVPENTAVDLVVSLGPEIVDVDVPSVLNQTEEAARETIVNAGLVVGSIDRMTSDAVPAGSVISQSPEAGRAVPPGTAIDLVVSLGPADPNVDVPSLTGLSQDDATAALIAADLELGAVTEANSDTVPIGNVISQTPATGEAVAPGTQVDLVISTGPGNDHHHLPGGTQKSGLSAAVLLLLASALLLMPPRVRRKR